MASHLFFLFLLYQAASETVVIRVEPGQDVILPCDAGDTSIRAAEWIRSDPKPSEDILFWTDGHSDTFKDRVYLVNDQLKTRDVSLSLKNVSREDNGTYECRVKTPGSRRNTRAVIKSEPISIVQLQVTDPENQKEYISGGDIKAENSAPHHVGLGAAVGVLVCLTFSFQQI
ncbi:hepatitis A virus cellular receptor 2-like [Sparus aurata]|uniref:hepatitis A virus cellular receptor 2-like n=1 Tax=Sparus aurata TaxID=8175 RepID=UPI0011C0C99D|nr:hepatitis A virus cellular receptor 2-like [Sparus aurata]